MKKQISKNIPVSIKRSSLINDLKIDKNIVMIRAKYLLKEQFKNAIPEAIIKVLKR